MEEEKDQSLLERILDGAEDPRDLPFALLKKITNDFSEERKIGQGGFGDVYKGVLGERTVAVKRIHINAHTFDDTLFRREATSLMKINHRNVVQFLGICSTGYQKLIENKDVSGEFIWANVLERLLCFEYISNGSLDNHIKDELRGLEWETRYEIITGICKGLRYLHKEKNIIHMDLKPANILLDHQDEKYMVPKITDFGLSRSKINSHTVGQLYGTLEYMAPEYRVEKKTTQSCDIYSLGLIIIELVTGCKGVPNKNNVLRRWRHRWKKPPTQLQYQQVTRCIDISGHCREKDPKYRPSISEIINILSESESTYCKIIPSLDEDDMLRINPLELRLPAELENEISCSVEITNDTCNCIFAFNIQLPNARYNLQPDKGIVRPKSKYSVTIVVQPRDVGECDHANKFIVQSMQVEASEGLRDEDIQERMFEKTRRFVDEVDLMVVYESMKPQETTEEHIKNGVTTSHKEEHALNELPQEIPNSLGETSSKENASAITVAGTNPYNNILENTANLDKFNETMHNLPDIMQFAPNEVHQGVPSSPGETSSKENASAVTVEGTNPCNNILENTANLDKCNETKHSLNPDISRLRDTENINRYIETNIITSQQEGTALKELHQDNPMAPGETSSKDENALKELHQDKPMAPGEISSKDGNALKDLHQDNPMALGEIGSKDGNALKEFHQDKPMAPGEISSKLREKDLVFEVRNEQGSELKQLRDLNNLHGRLEIIGLDNVKSKEEALEANLAAKERLTELKPRWYFSIGRCSPEVNAEVLEGLCPPVGLKKLDIHYYNGSRYPDWMVGKQNGGPNDLQELDLHGCTKGPAPQSFEGFPRLRVLRLVGGNRDALPSNMEHLTSLKKLVIRSNYDIRLLPTLPRSLEEFDLYDCNYKFMKSCATVGHPNWQKIEHIPKKDISGISIVDCILNFNCCMRG